MGPKELGKYGTPFATKTEDGYFFYGQTLLDYFAIRILQGELASQDGNYKDFDEDDFDRISDYSYKLAQSMLKAREKFHE